MELAHDTQLLLRRGTGKDNLLVLGERLPLVVVEEGELAAADDSGAARAVAAAFLFEFGRVGGWFGVAVKVAGAVDVDAADDAGITGNGEGSQAKVTSDLATTS